ncbi:MAG: GGDEF domain-containing protein [Aquisalimonadaceae bacterium]
MSGIQPSAWPSKSGPDLQLGAWRYARLLRPMLVFALLAHIVFFGIFLSLGVTVMAAFNVFSVLVYAILLSVTNEQRTRWVFLAGYLEVVAHTLLATHYVGWAAGFHLYPLVLMPMAAFLADFTFPERCLLIVLTTATSGMVAALYMGAAPAVQLGEQAVVFLNAGNIGAVFVGIGMAALHYAKAVQQAESVILRTREKLELLAATDPLTGLLNRRSMEPILQALLDAGRPLAVLLADIDHFKTFNDELGHEAGDQVLEAVGLALRTSLRDGDAAARWGGEEFLIVFPDRTTEEAQLIADRLRTAIAECWRGADSRTVSATIGIAMAVPGDSPDSIINRADKALLDGKRSGRDQTTLHVRPVH